MYSNTDPTMMLGRQSRVQTTSGVVNGTILAVGAKGVSVAVDREAVSYTHLTLPTTPYV